MPPDVAPSGSVVPDLAPPDSAPSDPDPSRSPLPLFRRDFLWGASTSAYQIEGAAAGDGRGPSIWDTFAHAEGRISDGSTGDVACDHYHRWPEDVALLAGLGANAYRFSISWPRIQPDGTGPANKQGLDFYDRLVDALAEHGISAVPTLFHWDLPQTLEDQGGWLNRDTAFRFARYTELLADRLGDRVTTWITLNEPFIHMALGYSLGIHAPGRVLGMDALPVAHHQLLAHGLAAAELRRRGLKVAIANNCTPVRAASDAEQDRAAAEVYDVLHNRLFNDPLLIGRYPDLSGLGAPDELPFVVDGDLEIISAPIDLLGVNYYNPTLVGAPGQVADADAAAPSDAAADAADAAAGSGSASASATPAPALPFEMRTIERVPITAFGWPVVPEGLTELLLGLRDRYGAALPPIVITENGCSTNDAVDADGRIRDDARIEYLDAHLRAVHDAVAGGVDVRGYLTWSLIDNFEWQEGFAQRFGLVRVDFDTLERTPKDSYAWFRDVIADQRAQSASADLAASAASTASPTSAASAVSAADSTSGVR